jgi:hypothetical protein
MAGYVSQCHQVWASEVGGTVDQDKLLIVRVHIKILKRAGKCCVPHVQLSSTYGRASVSICQRSSHGMETNVPFAPDSFSL